MASGQSLGIEMPDKKTVKVFVVDDEKVISWTIAAILHNAGFDASAFTNPLDALKAAETECPDLLISDVIMPQLNGIDLGVQFNAIYPSCKVLLFSGQAATSDMLENARSGGHDFNVLVKPVHPTDLLSAIQKLIDLE